jgi:hypothetical protein
MNRMIGLALLVIVSPLVACSSAIDDPPMVGLAEPDASFPAQYAQFYGVWSGKWDDYWDVTFVIDDIDDNGSLQGHYYWKENVPGPWSHQILDGQIENDTAQLGNIRIELDTTMADTAIAYGDFPTDRTALLRKLPPL